jgi:Alkylmercury lyase
MDQTLHRLRETFGIVTPIARQRTLPPPVRQLHQLILRHFAELAATPEPGQLREWAHQLDTELDAARAQLVAVDLVEADPATARLLGAYPFSAIPRGHKVELAGGPTVEAYCAIDALGIPAMLSRDVVISSRDPDTGEPISITVTNGQASWRPDDTVVVLGNDRSCGVSACSRCPYITFHSSPATAAAHLQAAHLAGEILTQPQALAAGTLLFGDLLQPVVPEPATGTSESGGPTTDHRQIAG